MFLSITVLALCCSLVNTIFFPIYPKLKLGPKPSKDAGDPLFLTPYIERGLVKLAQNLSRVYLPHTPEVASHAGFLTINKQFSSNLYFWYFLPFSKNHSAPVILWLQGGPGCSSLYGLFAEIGPLCARNHRLVLRKYHWTLRYHVIFIDSPVGTGFSFSKNSNGYCVNQECIAKGLYRALWQFFQLFPLLLRNDFYIAGESYAGKYIPSLGMEIHKQNARRRLKMNLKGMALGNAYCDPLNQLDYGNYLYQHGMLDGNELGVFIKIQMDIYVSIRNKNWLQANILMDRLMDGQVTHFSLFKFYTGYDSYYNYLHSTLKNDATSFITIVHRNDVRRSMHVGGLPFNDGETVQLLLALDMMQSVAPCVAELLSHYRMLFYNGQLDIVVAYPLTENFLNNLNFAGAAEYKRSGKIIWKVGKNLAGYIKNAGNLTEALVRNSGHMVPQDQPKWALDLITRFIERNYA